MLGERARISVPSSRTAWTRAAATVPRTRAQLGAVDDLLLLSMRWVGGTMQRSVIFLPSVSMCKTAFVFTGGDEPNRHRCSAPGFTFI
jgi:hypothetical protein